VAAVAAVSVTLAGCGSGAAQGGSIAEIATYAGPDRADRVLAGAQAEQHLLWYTTIIPDQLAQPLANAFEAKYPFADVQLFRGNSNEVAQRVVQEHQGRRYEVDLVDGTGTASLLEHAGILQPFRSPELDPYGDQLKDPDGFWGPELQYVMVAAYNTDIVSPADAPRTRADLLDPRWTGRMAWSTSATSGAPLFIGDVLETMGDAAGKDYLGRLVDQDVRNIDASGRAVLDQVASGQIPMALSVFNDQVEFSKAKGAPVGWSPLDSATAQLSRISLVKGAPHPHLAMLFLDFMFSEEGQRVIADGGGIPARPGVDAKVPELKPEAGGFQAHYLDPETSYRNTEDWTDQYEQEFVQ